jgi:hypothetical protein
MRLQDDYHLMSLTLKGNDSSGKRFPRNSYVNSEKCHERRVGNGREGWNCALIDAVFSLRFSSTFKKRGAKMLFSLRKGMTNQIKQQFFQFEDFGSSATSR